jgi:Coenzyme PQQ synthesis protein D (PqqD)
VSPTDGHLNTCPQQDIPISRLEDAMVTLTQTVWPHPKVVDTQLDTGETVLLHLESQTYYSLNVTGTRIWQGLKQGLPLQEISRQLQARFAVEPERADRSVLALVDELLQQQLVQRLEG